MRHVASLPAPVRYSSLGWIGVSTWLGYKAERLGAEVRLFEGTGHPSISLELEAFLRLFVRRELLQVTIQHDFGIPDAEEDAVLDAAICAFGDDTLRSAISAALALGAQRADLRTMLGVRR